MLKATRQQKFIRNCSVNDKNVTNRKPSRIIVKYVQSAVKANLPSASFFVGQGRFGILIICARSRLDHPISTTFLLFMTSFAMR